MGVPAPFFDGILQDKRHETKYTLGKGGSSMEHKIAYRDSLLGVEALTFDGLSQSFPPHFHPYYVVGLMDGGTRRLT